MEYVCKYCDGLNSQGILVLLNIFFSPAVVAARAISLQVNMAANQFVTNFRQAANPQIVKKYASGDYEGSKKTIIAKYKVLFFYDANDSVTCLRLG